MRKVHLTQEMNPKIPSYNGYISIRSLNDINFFVGLETDTKASLKLSHSHVGADIKDIDFQVEIVEGNSLNSNFKWRAQLGEDIKTLIKTSILYFDKMNKNKTLDDLELIVKNVGESSIILTDRLVDLSNLDIKSIFNPLQQFNIFARLLIKDEGNTKKLVQYYIGGLEFLVSYR